MTDKNKDDTNTKKGDSTTMDPSVTDKLQPVAIETVLWQCCVLALAKQGQAQSQGQ